MISSLRRKAQKYASNCSFDLDNRDEKKPEDLDTRYSVDSKVSGEFLMFSNFVHVNNLGFQETGPNL